MFLKILVWFWASLVIVALALELAISTTTTSFEDRVHRFSDNALTSHAREAATILDREGPPGVTRYLADVERATGIHAMLLAGDGHEVSGQAVSPAAAAVAARARESGRTEMDADGQKAVKARAVTVAGDRQYVLVATMRIGLMRLLPTGRPPRSCACWWCCSSPRPRAMASRATSPGRWRRCGARPTSSLAGTSRCGWRPRCAGAATSSPTWAATSIGWPSGSRP
jgi:hypothetical protein